MSLRCLFDHKYEDIYVGVENRPDCLQSVYVQRCTRCGHMWPDLSYDYVRGDMGVHPHTKEVETRHG